MSTAIRTDSPVRESAGRRVRVHLSPVAVSPSSIPALDGLRAVAILLVMAFHAWYNLPSIHSAGGIESSPLWKAQTGVQLFFVLSGFLLFLPYARWILGVGRQPDLLLFYRRRLLRVGPAFWASLVILVLAGPFTVTRLGYAALHAVYLFNAVPGGTWQFNSVYWTLAVEVQFYAVLPLIGWAAWMVCGRIGVARGMVLLACCAGVVSAASALLAHRHRPLGVVWTGLLGRYSLSVWLSVFTAGILGSVVYTRVRSVSWAPRQQQVQRAATGGLVVALAVLGALTFLPRVRASSLANVENAVFGWAYAGILLCVLLGPAPARRLLESRALRTVGLVSYSLYIWHLVIYEHVAPHLSGLHGVMEETVVGFLIELVLCVPVAYASYQLTERPFLRARRGAREELRSGGARG